MSHKDISTTDMSFNDILLKYHQLLFLTLTQLTGKEVTPLDDYILKKYIPMTETIYYVLLALKEERHGYAIIQYISQLTDNRIQMGTGTLYTMLGRLVDDRLITIVSADSKKKTYRITPDGDQLLQTELARLAHQLKNGEEVYESKYY